VKIISTGYAKLVFYAQEELTVLKLVKSMKEAA